MGIHCTTYYRPRRISNTLTATSLASAGFVVLMTMSLVQPLLSSHCWRGRRPCTVHFSEAELSRWLRIATSLVTLHQLDEGRNFGGTPKDLSTKSSERLHVSSSCSSNFSGSKRDSSCTAESSSTRLSEHIISRGDKFYLPAERSEIIQVNFTRHLSIAYNSSML
jgi:hypothetical protein